jgi:capsular polysaccharide biosynthesis protein
VYPESFETFSEQIKYFSECKVLAGISGSALSNCIFMKPGGTVIELLSVFDSEKDMIEIHHFYRIMATAMRHLYFSVSNLSGKSDDFINNKKYLDIIKML